MNTLMAIVLGCGLLYVYVRAVESQWPSSYFALDTRYDYALTQSPVCYSLFRFGPVGAVTLFAAVTLDRYGEDPKAAILGIVLLHTSTTTVRTAWSATVTRKRRHEAVQWPLFLLHGVTTLGLVLVGLGAIASRRAFQGLIPEPKELAAEIWGALLAAVGAVFLLGVVDNRRRTKEAVLARSISLDPPIRRG